MHPRTYLGKEKTPQLMIAINPAVQDKTSCDVSATIVACPTNSNQVIND